jgi:hypothetical protein
MAKTVRKPGARGGGYPGSDVSDLIESIPAPTLVGGARSMRFCSKDGLVYAVSPDGRWRRADGASKTVRKAADLTEMPAGARASATKAVHALRTLSAAMR